MTFIAVHADRDHADIVTDTSRYTVTQSAMRGRSSKVVLLPTVDAAIAVHGSADFLTAWAARATYLAEQVTSFDELTANTETHLIDVWNQLVAQADELEAQTGGRYDIPRVAVFQVGHSRAADRFVARVYASDRAFAGEDLHGLCVFPSPFDRRPSTLELERLHDDLPAVLGDPETAARVFGRLQAQPVVPVPPAGQQQWADLAYRVRLDRSLAPNASGLQVPVAGDVMRTHVTVGAVEHRRIHTFDDTGAEFMQMMAGTLHPLGQLGPCPCRRTDLAFVDCCLAPLGEQPCPCGSPDTATFAQCCSIRAGKTTTSSAVPGYGASHAVPAAT